MPVDQIASSFVCRRLETERLAFNVREAGSGMPVLFLHGITAVAAVWDSTILSLQDSFRCIAVDQRGHGYSGKPATGYSARDYADDVVGLMDALEIESAVVVGHSLGSRNAQVAACLYPERVNGVVAIDFTPFMEQTVFDVVQARVANGNRTFRTLRDVETYLAARYPKLPVDAVRRRAVHAYTQTDGEFRPLADPQAMIETMGGLRLDLSAAASKVKQPLLMIRGGDSHVVSEVALEQTLRLRPDFLSLTVPGADHYVPEEAPEIVADAIRRFADKNCGPAGRRS